jgi:hypothetical protein
MRLLFCGLAAFMLTLAFSFWQGARHDAAPVTRVAPGPPRFSAVSAGTGASNPTTSAPAAAPATAALASAVPAAAAMPPSPSGAARPAEGVPDATPEVEEVLARGDRGAERGSRSH